MYQFTNKKLRKPIRSFESHSLLVDERAFTIVELLVSMTLFISVITLLTLIFTYGLRSQRNLGELITVTSNASAAMEQMAREIRTGSAFCSISCPSGELQFTNAEGNGVLYTALDEQLMRSEGGETESITAENVRVVDFDSIVGGTESADGLHTRVTVRTVIGSTKKPLLEFLTTLQTTISPRTQD